VKLILSSLNDSEKELILKGPLLVCILIAGADGEIDNTEVKEAIQIAQNQKWVKSNLQSFFKEVATDFEDKLKIILQAYPVDAEKRNAQIVNELSQLDSLWGKLEPDFAHSYYDMLRYLAQKIAASSGRFWKKIGDEEARLLDLPMVNNPTKK
jgi:hypothetical protein